MKIVSTFALLRYMVAMEVEKLMEERKDEEVPEQAASTSAAHRLLSIWKQRRT